MSALRREFYLLVFAASLAGAWPVGCGLLHYESLEMSEPNWNELKADCRVIWDALPNYGLAVYAGTGGEVIVLSIEHGQRAYATIAPPEFPAFMAAMQRAMQEAKEISLEVDVAYATHLAIEKAREGV